MKEKLITLLQTIVNKIRGLHMTSPIPQEEYVEYLEDVIGVVNDADLDVPNELPDTTSASAGDVLGLDNDKNPAWLTPSSGGGVLVVTDTEGTLDKTWQEIHDAMLSGGAVVQIGQTSVDVVACVFVSIGMYKVRSYSSGNMILYETSSASGYPVNDK